LYRVDGIDSAVPLNYTPLAWATILDNRVGVERLIYAGAMVNLRGSGDGHTALTAQSILSPHDDYSMSSTQLLLDGSLRQDLRSQGLRALQNAFLMQKWGLAKILIDVGAGAPVNNGRDVPEPPPLYCSALYFDGRAAADFIALLMDLGAQCSLEDANGNTAADVLVSRNAREQGFEGLVNILRLRGAQELRMS
jgi:hypothetical protein